MKETGNYLFVVQFTAGSESGLALVVASDERAAAQGLKNTGKYNAIPGTYIINQTRNIGLATSIRQEVLMESYVNALVAYDAICKELDGKVGPPGPQGPQGIPGRDGANGKNGESAYQIAVDHGYVGTEEEWIQSLQDGGIWERGPLGYGAQLQYTPVDPDEHVRYEFTYTNGSLQNGRVFKCNIEEVESDIANLDLFRDNIIYPEVRFDINGVPCVMGSGSRYSTRDPEYGGDGFEFWLSDITDYPPPASVPETGTLFIYPGSYNRTSVSLHPYSFAVSGGTASGYYTRAEASGFAWGLGSKAGSGAAFGLFALAENDGELACGQANRSNEDTLFSVGYGETYMVEGNEGRSNLLEVTTEGIFVRGVGDYNGKNPDEADSLSTVISSLISRIETLEQNNL